jgi:hypothetical protein
MRVSKAIRDNEQRSRGIYTIEITVRFTERCAACTSISEHPHVFREVSAMQHNTKPNGQHIRLERLVRFMLDGVDLTVEEHKHFCWCDHCKEEMSKEVADELTQRSNTSRNIDTR